MGGDLFSQTPAQEAKAEAIERVGANAPSEWVRKARAVTLGVARANPEGFTSDAVWCVLDACGYGNPPEPRALGAVFHAMARDGFIIKTGRYLPSERESNHARPVAEWKLAVALDPSSPLV